MHGLGAPFFQKQGVFKGIVAPAQNGHILEGEFIIGYMLAGADKYIIIVITLPFRRPPGLYPTCDHDIACMQRQVCTEMHLEMRLAALPPLLAFDSGNVGVEQHRHAGAVQAQFDSGGYLFARQSGRRHIPGILKRIAGA